MKEGNKVKKGYISNAIGHFKTITRYRHAVARHCFKAGIFMQGIRHDLSKYTPVEFIQGIKYYAGTYSPNETERKEKGYSSAWLHHKGRNKHHFEYWTDYNPQVIRVMPVKMPKKYVIEMFCDRVAASKIYQGKNYTSGHPLEYFESGKARRSIHPETSDYLESLLAMLKEKGEDYTFKHIKETKNLPY